jgi:ankyrin repeat protein
MFQPEELKHDRPLMWSTGTGTDVWALFCACVAGDLAAVKRLVEKDPPLARCQYHYRKPLYFAVRENRLDVVEYLLDRDPDPTGLAVNDSLLDIARDRGYTDIERLLETKLAARFGASSEGEAVAAAMRAYDLPRVRALLDAAPERVHVGDARGNRPIHWAAMTRQLDAIDELLARGADINAVRTDGARPIQLTNGDYHYRGWRDVPQDHSNTPREVLDYLRSRGAYCDICTAAHIGDLARVAELLDEEPTLANRPDAYVSYYPCSGTAIRNAAAAGHLEVVQLLLTRGADPNLPEEGIAPRGHALYSAATNGHYEVARLLLEHGAYPNVEVESSADTLSRVLSNGDERMLELLCSHGAARPVHLLACFNDLQTAAAVFAANPALADDPEALANAAGSGHEPFVRLMLRYVPDLPSRVTFPAWSVGAKTRELNELLFQHGMDPSAPNWLGITPLHELARQGDIEKAAIYLDHGADLNARDEDIRSTPLGWAAKFGRKEMVEFLLARGARPNLADDPPWATPLAWATRRGHTEVANLLQRHGAT